MPPRIPSPDAARRRAPALAVLLAVALTALASGCHPETAEARRLGDACEAGDAPACNDFATRLQQCSGDGRNR